MRWRRRERQKDKKHLDYKWKYKYLCTIHLKVIKTLPFTWDKIAINENSTLSITYTQTHIKKAKKEKPNTIWWMYKYVSISIYKCFFHLLRIIFPFRTVNYQNRRYSSRYDFCVKSQIGSSSLVVLFHSYYRKWIEWEWRKDDLRKSIHIHPSRNIEEKNGKISSCFHFDRFK